MNKKQDNRWLIAPPAHGQLPTQDQERYRKAIRHASIVVAGYILGGWLNEKGTKIFDEESIRFIGSGSGGLVAVWRTAAALRCAIADEVGEDIWLKKSGIGELEWVDRIQTEQFERPSLNCNSALVNLISTEYPNDLSLQAYMAEDIYRRTRALLGSSEAQRAIRVVADEFYTLGTPARPLEIVEYVIRREFVKEISILERRIARSIKRRKLDPSSPASVVSVMRKFKRSKEVPSLRFLRSFLRTTRWLAYMRCKFQQQAENSERSLSF